MAENNYKVEGDDYLVLGSDSYTNPQKLEYGEYVEAMNVINRGGLVQTRPGTRTVFTVPDGNFQGMTLFTPANGIPNLVFMVDGAVYVSPFPFITYVQLNDIQFSLTAKYAAWENCLKSTDYTDDGILYYLDNPYSVLVIQDGLTPAAYWDGTIARHLNPAPSNQELTLPGMDETPLGLWMKWSNNRLWVSRGNLIKASDIGNPLKFTETQYLNEARAFYLPGNCTGIAETSDQQGIICFTDNTGTFLKSSIQDRTLWLSTPDFQKTILPNTGCVAPRSIVLQYGLIWWYCARGLINQNEALRTYIDTKITIQDNEMFSTKYNMSYDLGGICGTFYENFLLQSVPNGDVYNTRTMVLDQAPFEGNANAWPSFWTGWRPIEWAKGVIDGEERSFFASRDFDGKNRIWEAFTPEKTDNGVPITCYLMTREHLFGDRDWKKFLFAEIEVREIVNKTAFSIYASSIRGAFQLMSTKDVVSSVGQVYADQQYGEGAHDYAGSRPQTRLIKTQMLSEPSACNEECIETEKRGLIDKGFSLMVLWSGIAGLSTYRIFCEPYAEPYAGNCELDETGPRLLSDEGCGELSDFSTDNPFPFFTGSYTANGSNPISQAPVSYTAVQTSRISQADADRKALLAAEAYVNALIQQAFNAGQV
jgi:hypothetical protein